MVGCAEKESVLSCLEPDFDTQNLCTEHKTGEKHNTFFLLVEQKTYPLTSNILTNLFERYLNLKLFAQSQDIEKERKGKYILITTLSHIMPSVMVVPLRYLRTGMSDHYYP